MPTGPVPRRRRRHRRHDRPDTEAAFRKAALLPEGPQRRELRREIVCAWMPMATRLARHFRDRGESLEDLEQVARLGLVKAVARFDPERGTAFESYAVPTIVGEVKRHFRDHLWDLHVPRRAQELRNRVRQAHRELAEGPDGTSPDVARLAEHTGLSPAEVRTGLTALDGYAVLSLDAEPAGADRGSSLLDSLGAPEPGFDLVVRRESVRRRLRRLPARERHILYLRFFRDLTQRQIGERLGISQMHVSRLLARTCTRLREQVEPGRPAARRPGGPPTHADSAR